MKWLLRKCTKCKTYTLKDNCPNCETSTTTPHPPKFSPHDKYTRYRQEPQTEEVDKAKTRFC